MQPLPRFRSLLFFPGSDPKKFDRALGSGADAVVADLEDAVPPEEKAAARALVVERLAARGEGGPAIFVRVNGWDSPWGDDDLAALAGGRLDAVVVPKASPEAIAWAGEGDAPIVAVIETAAGLRSAYEVACAPRVQQLQLGAADLGAELGLVPRPDGQEILFARSQLVVDSAAAGIRPPVDVVHLDVRDEAGLAAQCDLARSLGLRSKACIHPAQIAVVNRAFGPTDADLEWAREVVEAFDAAVDDGRGALLVRGALVDLPIVVRARELIAEAERGE